ncbi:V8-like Glu-specific endopeptidase [Prosthecobacter fusiformis]|uniref:V8-like Glu-specific endopeptidase n=1 Tax=Prosthecobacter fusiformis TaxID=48464 RepID=A0A4R7RLN7_9BACT|nr:trypsin-like peptidase domain-containing protein [Prosthecobacter fusiformis]TDU63064.1 V8-like Glu-specific endopeptidase [Prosthecobacter fusiformis]
MATKKAITKKPKGIPKSPDSVPDSPTRWMPRGNIGARLPNVKTGFKTECIIPAASSIVPFSSSLALHPIAESLERRLSVLSELHTTPQVISNPNAMPWSSHVLMEMVAIDGKRKIGSGWVIGPRTIITAGHCVYDGGWMREILITPGGHGSQFTKRIRGIHWNTTDDWINGSTSALRESADVGVVYLDQDISIDTGILKYATYSDSVISRIPAGRISVAGFPADPYGTFLADSGTLRGYTASHLIYDIQTYKGQSGAPVLYWERDDSPTVIGIHHWDVTNNLNRAIRITPEAASLLLNWTA